MVDIRVSEVVETVTVYIHHLDDDVRLSLLDKQFKSIEARGARHACQDGKEDEMKSLDLVRPLPVVLSPIACCLSIQKRHRAADSYRVGLESVQVSHPSCECWLARPNTLCPLPGLPIGLVFRDPHNSWVLIS